MTFSSPCNPGARLLTLTELFARRARLEQQIAESWSHGHWLQLAQAKAVLDWFGLVLRMRREFPVTHLLRKLR